MAYSIPNARAIIQILFPGLYGNTPEEPKVGLMYCPWRTIHIPFLLAGEVSSGVHLQKCEVTAIAATSPG